MMTYDFKLLTGEVITREDFEYEDCRKQWNRAIEKYPLVIVYCHKEMDVKNVILWARKYNLDIRIRSGGHHYEGYSTGNDVVVIDVSKMNYISVDEENSLVNIQGGVRNRELYEVLGERGYPFPGGGCPTVGVVGFTLGGGWGYSSRYLGLGCDSLKEAEIINYKGEKLTVNHIENRDLFWALRGAGGGNFGVVTSMTFNLSEKIQMATLINMDYPNRGKVEMADIVRIYQDIFNSLDIRSNFKMAIYNSKENGMGIKFTGVFYGNKEEANEIIMPLKDISGEFHITMDCMRVIDVNRAIQDSHPEYESYKSAGRFVDRYYSKEEVMKLINLVEDRIEGSIYTALSFYGLGGKVRNIGYEDTAFYYREAPFIMGLQSVWEERKFAEGNIQWIIDKLEFIKTLTKGSFVNFPLGELRDYEEEYYGENIKKLRAVKKEYDPLNIFKFEQGIVVE